MKLAVFFSDSTWASWSLTHGMASTLKRMGNEAVSCGVPALARITRDELAELKRRLPTVEDLQACDAVLLSGPEHVLEWVNLIYGHASWQRITAPKLGWYHESFVRPDYALNFENYRPWIDLHFMPNPDDAAKYGQEWLPAGVDVEVFRPVRPEDSFEFQVSSFNVYAPLRDSRVQCGNEGTAEYTDPSATPRDDSVVVRTRKQHDVAFVGLLYQKRAEFLQKLRPHLGGIRLRTGNVEVQGIDGTRWQEQTEMLAQTYREMKILLNLPSLSKVLVMKVLEAMACGTCVFTPHFNAEIEKRLGLIDGRHLVFYSEDDPAGLGKQLRYYIKRDMQREQMVRAGCEEVHRNHRLERRLEGILGQVDDYPRDRASEKQEQRQTQTPLTAEGGKDAENGRKENHSPVLRASG